MKPHFQQINTMPRMKKKSGHGGKRFGADRKVGPVHGSDINATPNLESHDTTLPKGASHKAYGPDITSSPISSVLALNCKLMYL